MSHCAGMGCRKGKEAAARKDLSGFMAWRHSLRERMSYRFGIALRA